MEKEARQTAQIIKRNDILPRFEVFEENHVPSWTRYEEGAAQFNVTMHQSAGWLSLTMREQGEKSAKETMMSLSPESALKLYEFLSLRFGDK